MSQNPLPRQRRDIICASLGSKLFYSLLLRNRRPPKPRLSYKNSRNIALIFGGQSVGSMHIKRSDPGEDWNFTLPGLSWDSVACRETISSTYTIRTETITNENLEILFGFRFRNGKANKFPQIFFRICFGSDHVGHAQATTAGHTYKIIKIQEIFFRFRLRNSTERKSSVLDFFFFACNCFCEDGI